MFALPGSCDMCMHVSLHKLCNFRGAGVLRKPMVGVPVLRRWHVLMLCRCEIAAADSPEEHLRTEQVLQRGAY
eukprot:scaffold226365_cov22-Tisochrysis_lutea.AAC.1